MAGSEYYNHSTFPAQGATGSSSAMRTELETIEGGFGKLPGLSGNGNKLVKINSGETAQTVSIISDDGSTATVAGAMTVTGALTPSAGITGFVIGANVQAYDAGLASIAGLTTAADRMIYTTASDTYAATTLTSFARTLLDDADATTARATIGLSGAFGFKCQNTSASVTVTGTDSIAAGDGAIVLGNQGVALGHDSSASPGGGAVSVGNSAAANGTRSVAIGNDPTAGGQESIAIGDLATTSGAGAIAVGNDATATPQYSVCIGDSASVASGSTNCVLVGDSASIGSSSQVSVVLGSQASVSNNITLGGISVGYLSAVTAQKGVAIGRQSAARMEGVEAFGNSVKGGNAQTLRSTVNKQTTDATTTTLEGDVGTTPMIMENNSAIHFTALVVGRDESTNDVAVIRVEGGVKRGANAAATSIVGSVTSTVVAADSGASTWAATATADTSNGGLNIRVTGEAATTISWTAAVNMAEVLSV